MVDIHGADGADLAVVGMGPRGASVLERLAANLARFAGELAGPLRIHVVDPFPPGAGRIWRADQSPLLRMNSLAADTTLFLDPSVTSHGPVVQGPNLAEWAASIAPDVVADADLADEARALAPSHFATRRLGGEYLRWCFDRAVDAIAAAGASVVVHAAEAIALDDVLGGRQRLVLSDGEVLDVDAVVLTLGHLDAEPVGEHAELVAHAAAHGLAYLPPEHADVPLDAFGPGEPVIVRGFGLDFVDKLVLMTEGRGGTFTTHADGTKKYHPSGREPHVHVGSRRGVPYRSKLDYELVAPRAPHPRFFTPEALATLVGAHEVLSFRRDVWPLAAKEIAWGYYHELFLGHPDRVTTTWEAFDAALAPLTWGTPAFASAVEAAVPDPEDRIDFETLDQPLAGAHFDDDADQQRWIRDHVARDVRRRTDQRYSADLGAFFAFLAVLGMLPHVLTAPNLPARSRVEDFDEWWFGFFSYFCSGPPPRRLHELVALADAGVVEFLGAGTRVTWDADGFRAASATSDRVVHARALIDARIPDPAVGASRSALVRDLVRSGQAVEQVLVDPDGARFALGQLRVSGRTKAVIDASGSAHPSRFAIGPNTTSRAPAFARRGTNSLALRDNDVVARNLLQAAVDAAGRRQRATSNSF